MSEFRIQQIPQLYVEHFWHFAVPYVKRALDHTAGEFSIDDLAQACIDGDMQLWLISQESKIVGAGTTKLIQYPAAKHCCVVTLAGSQFTDWVTMADNTIESWAQDQDCSGLSAYVRKGFVPKLTPLGYKLQYTVMMKEI